MEFGNFLLVSISLGMFMMYLIVLAIIPLFIELAASENISILFLEIKIFIWPYIAWLTPFCISLLLIYFVTNLISLLKILSHSNDLSKFISQNINSRWRVFRINLSKDKWKATISFILSQ